eukprot:11182560-Lingulodinium_polyedra.AAC.1
MFDTHIHVGEARTDFVLRRERQWARAEERAVPMPSAVKAAMLEEGASHSSELDKLANVDRRKPG